MRRTPETLLRPSFLASAGKVLLIMTVEIGNGQSDSIKVYPNDQPLQLAKDFCAKARSFCVEPQRTVRMSRLAEHQVHRSVARVAQHGLDPMVIVPLADNISSNISKLGRAVFSCQPASCCATCEHPECRLRESPTALGRSRGYFGKAAPAGFGAIPDDACDTRADGERTAS